MGSWLLGLEAGDEALLGEPKKDGVFFQGVKASYGVGCEYALSAIEGAGIVLQSATGVIHNVDVALGMGFHVCFEAFEAKGVDMRWIFMQPHRVNEGRVGVAHSTEVLGTLTTRGTFDCATMLCLISSLYLSFILSSRLGT